jgi:hypothetical protein
MTLPRSVGVGVFWRESVTAPTSFESVKPWVYGVLDDDQVRRIHAGAVAADVVNIVPVWNRPVLPLVSKPMSRCPSRADSTAAEIDVAVTSIRPSAFP